MKEQTKKKLVQVLVATSGAVVTLGVGGFIAYLNFFPVAQASPDLGNVLSYQVTFEQESVNMNENNFDELLSHLKSAKPTRQQSVNDRPIAESYYQINLEVDESPTSRRVYVYEDDGKVFYEIPYGGIYETDNQSLNLLLSN